jgi:hypothetical protein
VRKLIDLTGKRFGRLIVVKLAPKRNGSTYWECKCDCGKTKEIFAESLKDGDTRSCGCLQRDLWFKDLTGERFGSLIARKYDIRNGVAYWECDCDCGKSKEVKSKSLRSGTTRSCGCLVGKIIRDRWSRRSKYDIETNIFKRYMRIIEDNHQKGSKRRAELPMSITIDDLRRQWEKQRGICPYTGWRLILKRVNTKQTPMQASLDRIDSSCGYVPNNIQFISLMANYAKNAFNDDLMIYFCKAVARTHADSRPMSEDEQREIEQCVAVLESCLPDE